MNNQSQHLENIMNKHNRVSTLQIVFVDIEKYSKRKTKIQIAIIDEFTSCLKHALKEISHQHFEYFQSGNLNYQDDTITLPTGDGAAIVFSYSGLYEIHLDFARTLLQTVYQHNKKSECDKFQENGWCNCHSNFNLRIGISEGKGLIYRDLNGGYNVAGDVINMAARVMGLVGRNQIAFTADAYKQIVDLVDDPYLVDRFIEYPEVSIKHDAKLTVYQYIDDIEGLNSEPLHVRELSEQFGESYGTLERYREIDEAGFRRVFPNRQKFFSDLFKSILESVNQEIKIMGVCVSLFTEADRPERISSRWSPDRTVKTLADLIEKECSIYILFLKRYPSVDELKKYGMTDGDFYLMRERDEDKDENYHYGKRLKKIANRSLGYWIKIFLELTKRTISDPVEKRQELLSRLQIREYIALPSLSLYIVDDEIYVTPYLYKRHCSTVPAFQVGGKESELYIAYNAHFEKIWTNDEFTTPIIDERFIQLLAKHPQETLELYARKLEELLKQEKAKVDARPEYLEDPEYYRIEERTIEAVLGEGINASA